MSEQLPAAPADVEPSVGDLLDQITDGEQRELIEQQLQIALDPTASETARADAAEWIARSGLFR